MAKRVLVAGAGPAGLMAMWACLGQGHQVIVADIKPQKDAKPQENAGVFFLHDNCGLPLRKRLLTVTASGAPHGQLKPWYAEKVYGDSRLSAVVSIPNGEMLQPAYDGIQAINMLWDIAETSACYRQVDPFHSYDDVCRTAAAAGCDAIVCTIPMPALLPNRSYISKTVYVKRGIAPADEAYMMYNANPQVGWYRVSAVFGVFTMEAVLPLAPIGWTQVRKVVGFDGRETAPVRSTPEMLLTGRYGAWDKKLLTHDAYNDTNRWLKEHHSQEGVQ